MWLRRADACVGDFCTRVSGTSAGLLGWASVHSAASLHVGCGGLGSTVRGVATGRFSTSGASPAAFTPSAELDAMPAVNCPAA